MWSKLVYLLLTASLGIAAVQAYKDYKDYKIYEVKATTEAQQQVLLQLSKIRSIDFFTLGRKLNTTSKVLLPPFAEKNFLEKLSESNIYHSLTVDDFSQVLETERTRSRPKALEGRLNIFEDYYPYSEISAYLGTLAKNFPTRVFVKTFGRSYEGRPIKVVTITNGDGRTDKKVIFIDAAMHAREWITPAMALLVIDELVNNLSANAALLQDYDWVIVPVVNVDGYEYSHTEDRMWRKTRRPIDVENDCYGTDPNRNFGYHWGDEEGASTDPCDETYMGETAFSEPEAITIRDLMWQYGDRMKLYLSLHSYGNYILLPWGHTNELPENFFEMMDVADAGAMAILFATNSEYTYGSTYHVLYATSGDSADYAAGVIKVPVSIAMELPGGGWSGFDPPVRQIEGIITETWVGIKAMAEEIIKKY